MLILNIANIYRSVTSGMQSRLPLNTQYARTQNSYSEFYISITLMLSSQGTPMNICICLIFLQTGIIGLHFAIVQIFPVGSVKLLFLRQ